MKRTTIFPGAASLALAALLGLSGLAFAGPGRGHHPEMDMTPEQYTASQEVRNEFHQKIRPLQRQMFAKEAELDALYYNGVAENDPRVQGLLKEADDLKVRLQALHGEMRSRMKERGVPQAYGRGWGHGRPEPGHGCRGGYRSMRGWL